MRSVPASYDFLFAQPEYFFQVLTKIPYKKADTNKGCQPFQLENLSLDDPKFPIENPQPQRVFPEHLHKNILRKSKPWEIPELHQKQLSILHFSRGISIKIIHFSRAKDK